jgi:hypothetical protein
MDSIDPSALYDERGDVSWCRPLLQGDVFEQIVLPGFGDQPMMVQIVTHPCAMRKGPDLLERVTVAPVEPHAPIHGESGWNGNLRVMPLSELVDGKHYATKFVDVTAAPAELLSRDRRIASLSNRGIYVLQQRLVKHYTRFEVGLDLLRRQSAAVLEEAQQQWDWIETVVSVDELCEQATIEAEGKVFDAWLSEGNPSRRALLRDEVNHADLRKQARRAAAQRKLERA